MWLEQGIWHLWLFALIAAALAPYAVQLIGRAIERRVRARTDEMLARIASEHRATDGEHRTMVSDVERVEDTERHGP